MAVEPFLATRAQRGFFATGKSIPAITFQFNG